MKTDKIQLTLPAKHNFLEIIGTAVTTIVRSIPALENEAYNLQLAIHEGCANIIDHAVKNQEEAVLKVELELSQTDTCFTAVLKDHGHAYVPNCKPSIKNPVWKAQQDNPNHYLLTAVPEPGFDQLRGRGLFLMFNLVDQISYQTSCKGNEWVLRKTYQSGQ